MRLISFHSHPNTQKFFPKYFLDVLIEFWQLLRASRPKLEVQAFKKHFFKKKLPVLRNRTANKIGCESHYAAMTTLMSI